MIDEHQNPSRERVRQLRDHAVACELTDVIFHAHDVVRRGGHEFHRMESLNKLSFRRFLLSLNNNGRQHIHALFDLLSDDLREQVELIAMPKPAADRFGTGVVEVFGNADVPLVVLGGKNEECVLPEESASMVVGKKVLIVDGYRDLGGTMSLMGSELKSHGAFVLAGLVFLELLEHSLPVAFPVFSVRKRSFRSFSQAQCAWCKQQRNRSKQ